MNTKDPALPQAVVGQPTVARDRHRNAIGIELNPDYITIARRRLGLSDMT